MRKNKAVTIIGIFLFLYLIAPVNAQNAGVLELENISIPTPVCPGDTFNISFNIRNAWYGSIRDAYIHLEGDYPLLNTSPTTPTRIRGLGWGWFANVVPMSFDLTVDKSAIAGSYSVDVVLTYTRYSGAVGRAGAYERYRQVVPILITVKGMPKIDLFVKSSEPQKIKAGDTADLNLKVVNIGTDEAKNILLSTESQKPVDVLWFSKVVHVGDLSPQASKTASLSIEIDDDAEAKAYRLPIKIVYETDEGEVLSASDYLGITVEESADFVISPVSNSANSGDRDKRVVFNIKNSGTKPAEDVKVILRANYPFTPTGNEYFLGTLNPEESMDVSFHIDVDSDASSQRYPVDMIIQWKEDNDEYTKTKSSFIDIQRLKPNWQIYAAMLSGLVILIVIFKKIRTR